jgi:Fe-S-cluster-containing dehydrogenase component
MSFRRTGSAEDRKIMMKCDMRYDRSSVGKKPMCATVCPSQALFFGTREQIEQLRPMSEAVNRFQFGAQVISTQVFMMAPRRWLRGSPGWMSHPRWTKRLAGGRSC